MTNFESCEKSVLLNDFARQWADAGADVLDAVRTVGESGWYILGAEVEAFEKDLAGFWRRSFAIGVASGLDAIEIALRCAGCRPGDKVLMSPLSAFATALAAVNIGAVPVFVDCDRHCPVDLDLAERAVAADPSIRFFIPVHLYGHALDMSRLADFRDRLGVTIIEDCAQSIAASHLGRSTGTAGICAATSFYPTKNLGALGDGGAILTDSEEVATTARQLRNYGQSSKYHHTIIGYNSRLDELHGAILRRAFLPRLNEWTTRRRLIASRYVREISNPAIVVPGAPGGSDSTWHLFPVLIREGAKQEFMAHLSRYRIGYAEHYPISMADQAAIQQARHEEASDCPMTRQYCTSEVSLPIHPYLSEEEIIVACNRWSS
jgi:dTDP-3-amino-3,4,6-trideoxy-alpha-D-glucose transaminase